MKIIPALKSSIRDEDCSKILQLLSTPDASLHEMLQNSGVFWWKDFSWWFISEPNAQHIPFVISLWAGDSKPLGIFPVQKKSPWKHLLILYILSCLLNSHSSSGEVIPTDGKSAILGGVIAFSTADKTGLYFRWSSIPFFVTQVISWYFKPFGTVVVV